MSSLAEIQQQIESLLGLAPYGTGPQQHESVLLALLKQELAYACEKNLRICNYVQHWPVDFRGATRIADLPYLPVSIFKADPPLALVGTEDVRRTLTSSATTGQVPSRIVLDAATAKLMSKGVVTIIRDFIGPARRPYLVIDSAENLAAQAQLGARGAAIQSLSSFATELVCCLRPGQEQDSRLDLEKLVAFAAKWKSSPVLVYGFTYVIWSQLVQPLKGEGITLDMPNVHVLHSGGWKRLQQQAVTQDVFNRDVASAFGCPPTRVIDFYGMVENVGVVYPDCDYGNKHVPAFAEIIVRDPLTLAPVEAGQKGLIEVCSALPTSFPGFLLLTEDMAEVVNYDACACGRRGVSFRFAGRVPKAEVRGCGNLENTRYQRSEVGVA
jgi:hypothetical protein